MHRIGKLGMLLYFGFLLGGARAPAVPVLQVDMNDDGSGITLGSPAGWLQWNSSEIAGGAASKNFGSFTVSVSGNGALRCNFNDWEGAGYIPSSGELRAMVQDFLYAHDGDSVRIDMEIGGLKPNQPYEITTWHNVGFPLDAAPNRIDIIAGGVTVVSDFQPSLNASSTDAAASATFLITADTSGKVDLAFAASGAGGALDGWGSSNVGLNGFEITEFIDSPTIQFPSRASGNLETAETAGVTVVLIKGQPGTSYTVDYSVVGGTATSGVDYTLAPGTLTFGPGQMSKTIEIDIVDDGLDEEDETVVIELSNPGPGAQLGVVPQHTYTIKDPRPHISFAAAESEGSETENPAMIEVTLSPAVEEIIRVGYSVSGGTATAGDDYIAPSGTLVFNPGQTSKKIRIDILMDDIEEGDETIELALSIIQGPAVVRPYAQHTHTLTEAPGVQWDGMTWYFSQIPVRLSVNDNGELVWSNPWPPDQITVQLPEMSFSQVGEVVEIAYLYKGEGSDLGDAFGTGDIRIGLFDSNGQGHVDRDGHGYNNPTWCGYLGYKVNISPHVSTSKYSGRFAKREDPWCDVCTSLVQKNQGCWEGQDTQPKIDGFGLAGGQWSPLTLRLERTGSGSVRFTATLNNVTYAFEDDDPSNQPQKLDAMAMYFPNDRPFTSIMFAIPEKPTPSRPNPGDGSAGVDSNVVLRWKAGSSAVSQDVYFGTSYSAVSNAGRSSSEFKGNQDAELYNPGCLELGNIYYWRIDDVTAGATQKGSIWSFTTAECLTFEGFESYVGSEALRVAWAADGGAWNDLSTTEHHSGVQSMELQYYNPEGNNFSEVAVIFEDPQDYSEHNALGLRFKGSTGNQADRMYVIGEDTAGAASTVFYDGSSNDLRNDNWQLWSIDPGLFGGVNISSVKKLIVGVGDRSGSASGSSGILYIDDIGLCGGGCIPDCQCPGDLNDDGQVDLDDLQAVAGILLNAGSPFIVAVEASHCGDLNSDLQLDLEDLQAVAGMLLDAGSPFIVLCE